MPDSWEFAAILVKLMLYIGVTGATGLVLTRLLFRNLVTPLHRSITLGTAYLATLALVASALSYLLRGAALTGGMDGMTDPEMLGLLRQTPVGDALLYRLVGLGLILIGLVVPQLGCYLALFGGSLALWSFANIGHVAGLELIGAQLLLLLHLLVVAMWVGVLAPLHSLARNPNHLRQAAQLGHQFGQIATIAVPLLLLAGLALAWLILGDWRLLYSTTYGWVLIAKLALVSGVLMLAAANKLRFVPGMLRDDKQSAQYLARAIEIEAILILVVLAITATLTSVVTLPH